MDQEYDTICHYVRPEDEGDWDADYTKVKAVCGAECLIDPEGWPIPITFDFVIAPDERCLTDCMPCLAALAKSRVRERAVPA